MTKYLCRLNPRVLQQITTTTSTRPTPATNFTPSPTRRHTTRPQSTSTPGPLPLHKLRVLDLSRVAAGPFCTQILADYGAQVIKVEQPGIGDETRQWRTAGESQKWKDSHPLMSLYFAALNRNKRSITLNLKKARAVEIVKQLARESDVMVNNFLPGKMDDMGLGWEEMRRVNPRLIYASVSGYGPTGPARDRAGYDALALAEGGLLHITGEQNGPPTKPGVAIADLCTGLYTHGAILTGLAAREESGKGMRIDGSLFETSLSLLINVGLISLNLDVDKGKEGRRRGKRFGLGHPNLVPYGGFETADGRIMFVAANNNRQWKGFCEKMGVDGLGQDKRFGSNDGRVENREEINDKLAKRFKEKSRREWEQVFEGSGLPYGAINDVVEAMEHKQAEARNMVVEMDDFEAARDGMLKLIGPAMKFEGHQMPIRNAPPILGEHTEDVLVEAGLGQEEIENLRRDGVI